MDNSPAWRRIVFAVIVCVLVALGAYLIGPVAHRGGPPAHRHAAASAPTRSASPPPLAAASPSTGPPDIYRWLPFTSAGLAAAASAATRFGNAYGTYSYTENARTYGGSLQAVTSAPLVQQIEDAYSAPGVSSVRTSGKQVAVGAASIVSIRAFGPSSLTFIVRVAQKITGTSGLTRQTTEYSVTLTDTSMSWQVSSVELASVGNS